MMMLTTYLGNYLREYESSERGSVDRDGRPPPRPIEMQQISQGYVEMRGILIPVRCRGGGGGGLQSVVWHLAQPRCLLKA